MHRTRITPMTLQDTPRPRWGSRGLDPHFGGAGGIPAAANTPIQPDFAPSPRIRSRPTRHFEPRLTRPPPAQARQRHSTPIAGSGGAV